MPDVQFPPIENNYFADITKKEFFCGNSYFTRSFYYQGFQSKERGKFWKVVCIHPLAFLLLSPDDRKHLQYSGSHQKYLSHWYGDEIAVYHETDPTIPYLYQNYTEITPTFIPTKRCDHIDFKFYEKR